MPESENAGIEQHVLYMTELEPGLIELHTLSPPRGPAPQRNPNIADQPVWAPAVEQIVISAFAGRDVCFILGQPPIEWSDVELDRLGSRITTMQSGQHTFRLAVAEHVSRTALAEAAASQDFRYGGLLIAAIPHHSDERVSKLLTTLARAGAQFPDWKEWIRLPRETIASIHRAQIEAKLASNEEFMECVNDGEQLDWYHPQPAALARCRAELEAWAAQQGWQFISRLA